MNEERNEIHGIIQNFFVGNFFHRDRICSVGNAFCSLISDTVRHLKQNCFTFVTTRPRCKYHGFLLVGCGCALIEAYGVYCLNMQAATIRIDLPNHKGKEKHMIIRTFFTKNNMADRAEHRTVWERKV